MARTGYHIWILSETVPVLLFLHIYLQNHFRLFRAQNTRDYGRRDELDGGVSMHREPPDINADLILGKKDETKNLGCQADHAQL